MYSGVLFGNCEKQAAYLLSYLKRSPWKNLHADEHEPCLSIVARDE